jgi:aryl-alcohol dehydrogenase-like predicted oxidoreductase
MLVGQHLTESTFRLIDVLTRIAQELDTTAAAVALAWVRQQPLVTATVIGARTVAQLDANLASLQVTLSPDHLEELDRLTTPALDFPLPFLRSLGFPAQQGDTVINGLRADG